MSAPTSTPAPWSRASIAAIVLAILAIGTNIAFNLAFTSGGAATTRAWVQLVIVGGLSIAAVVTGVRGVRACHDNARRGRAIAIIGAIVGALLALGVVYALFAAPIF